MKTLSVTGAARAALALPRGRAAGIPAGGHPKRPSCYQLSTINYQLLARLGRAACLAWLVSAASSAGAITLTAVPMQGGMLMPLVCYHAANGTLTVRMPTEVPQLTPLLVSNPADGFSPADPWFDCLDPSRQGLSFSRRYGFDMDTASDPLPAGTALWIRKLSGSPELGAYRYRSSSMAKAWEPIFGTAGSTNALQWNQTMFHPAFTAPPGTNACTAVFELFLLDTNTGQPVPGASSGPLLFSWTNVPDGRPALSLALNRAGKVVIGWPATATNYVLETADSFSATEWTAVTDEPVWLDGQSAVVLDPAAGSKFFRMRRLP